MARHVLDILQSRFRNGEVAMRLSILATGLLCGSLITPPSPAEAASGVSSPGAGLIHCTDGGFNLHNGGSQISDATEWGGPNVSKTFFPLALDGSGGAYLYVEQGVTGQPNQLYLMYDYVAGTSAEPFFNVFFQVKDEDYLARIQGSAITVFVKPVDQPSTINADGTFNTGAPWTAADSNDLALGNFKGSVSFGVSPNSSVAHPLAEFELSVDEGAFGGGAPNKGTGLYDPSPSFWSASVPNGPVSGTFASADPPISSGIFQLSPDGGVSVTPVLGNAGGPVLQGNVVPEPGSLWMMGTAMMLLAGAVYRQTRRG